MIGALESKRYEQAKPSDEMQMASNKVGSHWCVKDGPGGTTDGSFCACR